MQINGRYQRVVELYEYYTQGKLDLSPIYQRNNVWDENMQSYLIDTILRGYTMPPIFIRAIVCNITKKTKYEVLDGQQRLTTIFKYIDDKFKVKRMHNPENSEVVFSDLSDKKKTVILNFEVSVMDVSDTAETEIYELFARLNSNNIKLNNQEIRSAKYHGYFKSYIVTENRKWSQNIFTPYKVFTKSNKARMLDEEYLAQLALLSDKGMVEGNKKNLDSIYEEYDAVEIPSKLDEELNKLFKLFDSEEYSTLVSTNNKFKNRSYIYIFASHYLTLDIKATEYTKYLEWFINYIELVDNKVKNDESATEFLKIATMRTTNKTSRERRLGIIDDIYRHKYE